MYYALCNSFVCLMGVIWRRRGVWALAIDDKWQKHIQFGNKAVSKKNIFYDDGA